ncbi:ABC transporter substrate-binding protein [Dethiobacter alkaliphilus]|uniref:Periplasmic binding protein n=1 Tax=Dethiobacter alkaliphilus AHT 1 TaxID=555088 RepID=C0GK80_DETAL|nr:cobalamin-binding protein [Dethiobacter alkaliphilus]EEG76263.1 periplasmic binding protein [Dethiobacter alkaliphilus AHT 1]
MQKVSRVFFILALGLLLVFAAGCGNANDANEPNGPNGANGSNGIDDANGSESQSFAELTDQMGRNVVIEEKPERIVSLSPSNTEMAFSIGLGSRIVGVTDFCDYPAEALDVDKIGGFSDPNMEIVYSLTPDLVLAGNAHEEQVNKLEELGIPVLVLAPESIEEVFAAMNLIAEATGASEADKVITEITDRLALLDEKISTLSSEDRVQVYYEVYSDPLMTAGGTTLISEVISIAGGDNIFTDVAEMYPQISEETIIERDPSVIVIPNYHGFEGFDMEVILDRPLWNEINAVKNERVFNINADAISRPGPRLIEAAETLAPIFHPELFD